MVLYGAVSATLLAIQASQPQIVVQCPSPVAEPAWKWIVQATFQLLLSIIPVAGGVWIALWSFQKNSKKENEQWIRNSDKERKQWLRDHKKSDWSELVKKAAQLQQILVVGSMENRERFRAIAENLKPAVRELSETQSGCLFLSEFFEKPGNLQKFVEFLKEADECSDGMDGWISIYNTPDHPQDRQLAATKLLETQHSIMEHYLTFMTWLRAEAIADLAGNS